MVALMVAFIVALPLTTGTPILTSAGKRLVFEVLGSLLIALVLSQATLRPGRERLCHVFLAGPHLPIVLFLTYAAASALGSAYKLFSFIEFFHLGLCVLIYFACVYYLPHLRQVQQVCGALLAVSAAVSLIALAQMADTSQEAVTGPFLNHLMLGSFLMLVFPLALSFCLLDRGEPLRSDWGETLRKVTVPAITLLTGAALLIARARSAWLGEVVSLVILSCLRFAYMRRADISLRMLSRNKHLVVTPIAIVVSVTAFVYFSQAGGSLSQVGGSLSHRLHTFSELGTDNAFQARLYMWRGARQMIAAHPFFGWGIGTYTLHEPGFTHLNGNWAFEVSMGPTHTNHAHSYYLQTMTEMGVLGLGLYTAVIATFFVTGIRALGRLENGTRKAILIASLSGVGGQVVDAATSPSYNLVPVLPFLWLLMGIGMSCAFHAFGARLPSERGQSSGNDRPQRGDRPRQNAGGGAGLARFARFAVAAAFIFAVTAPLIKETNPRLPVSDAPAAGGGRFTVVGVDSLGTSHSGTTTQEAVLASTPGSAKTVTISAEFTDGHNSTFPVRPSGFRLTGDYLGLVKGTHNPDGTFTVERNGNPARAPDTLLVTATYSDGQTNEYAADYPIKAE